MTDLIVVKSACRARCVEECKDIRRSDLFWMCFDDCYHRCLERFSSPMSCGGDRDSLVAQAELGCHPPRGSKSGLLRDEGDGMTDDPRSRSR